ncbi:MAG: 30S ribosomal protein S6 [Fimbriimonadia bacterium]
MELRQYEVLYIVAPEVSEPEVEALIARFDKVVADNGGEVEKSGVWEKRRLAYEISGRREGVYCLMHIKAPPALPKELTRQMSITEHILRVRVYSRDPERDAPRVKKAKVEVNGDQ